MTTIATPRACPPTGRSSQREGLSPKPVRRVIPRSAAREGILDNYGLAQPPYARACLQDRLLWAGPRREDNDAPAYPRRDATRASRQHGLSRDRHRSHALLRFSSAAGAEAQERQR